MDTTSDEYGKVRNRRARVKSTMGRKSVISSSVARKRRGVFFIWFALIGLPAMLFGLTLSADVSSVINVNRQIRLAAESAAVAGSFQFERSGSGRLDQGQASAVAYETFQEAIRVGAITRARVSSHGAVTTATEVSYRVSYQIQGLLALRWFAPAGVAPITIVEKAEVCPSGSYCGRPDTDRYGSGSTNLTDGYSGHYPPHYPLFYAPHYPGHYPAHYPGHYPGHYPSHYPGHYPRHYPSHYPSQYYPPFQRRY